MSNHSPSGTEGYAKEAPTLLQRYERRRFEDVHEAILEFLPTGPSDIVDIGAGTGRDAAYFASKGHRVTAVEPTGEMREPAMKLHPSPRITWLDDSLPALSRLRAGGKTFDVVMMNAVWMHLDAGQREVGLPYVGALVRPGGKLFMSLRHGPVPEGRRMFEVTAQETIALAEPLGLRPLFNARSASIQPEYRAAGVMWTRLVFAKDG